jgi:hypothetical protein
VSSLGSSQAYQAKGSAAGGDVEGCGWPAMDRDMGLRACHISGVKPRTIASSSRLTRGSFLQW